MFLYNSFKKWLCVADQNCTKKASSFLERKPDDSEIARNLELEKNITDNKLKPFFRIGKFRLDIFFRKIAWVGLCLRSDYFSWGGPLTNCLFKEKKTYDFGAVNFSVHRNRETLLAIFSLLIKPIKSNMFSNNDPALQF